MDPLFAAVDQGKHSVVGRDEMVPVARGKNRSALCSYAWIDHYEMDRRCWEIIVCLGDGQRPIKQVKRLYGMANVHDLGIRDDLQDHTLHGSDVMIIEPKIGGQSNDRTVRQMLSSL